MKKVFVLKHSYIKNNLTNENDYYACKTRGKCVLKEKELNKNIDYWETGSHKFEILELKVE